MKPNLKHIRTVLLIAMLFVVCDTQAKVKLPAVFSDFMVLQQKTNAAVWGKADPGKTIEISSTWNRKRYTAKTDANGNWKIMVATPSYGGPYAMTISDGEPTIIMNVMIGEVWVCSGQSNMEMPLAGWGRINNYEKEVADANYPSIRLLQVDHITSNSALEDAKVMNGGWKPCISQYVSEFSSVAYFFARELYKKTGIPIGLIHTSWGGTIAEAWTSANTLKTIPDFAEAVKKLESKSKSDYANEMATWQKEVSDKDEGNHNPGWLSASVDESSWKKMALPGFWEESGLPDFDGIVYFRKHVSIPKSWEGKSITVNLGAVDDNDITFFNGEKIGETEGYSRLRVYTIPGDKVKAGVNVLAVRVFDGGGGGGIYGEKNTFSMVSAGGESISLTGDWNYNVGLNFKKDVPPMPVSNDVPNRPTVLYNAMINPFIQYAIKGAIWYQGESNAERAHQYRTLFPAMITDWRTKWKQGDFPFYFVQLANYMKADAQPVASAWAELRDAQLQTLSLPNTGMAVTIDVGNPEDIHPKNKQEVGRRLALIALANTYGYSTPYSGPALVSHTVQGDKMKLSFKFTSGGLKVKDAGTLTGFAIAGADQKFYWAKAVISGNEVIVSSPNVPNPVAIRYGWGNNPACSLYNGAGLPASPFRTDNWEDSTIKAK